MSLTTAAFAAPVINEIMFHPPGAPEAVAQEWVEIYNPDPFTVEVSGWSFTKGVTFTMPAGTTIGPLGYLVVAADVTAFQAANPAFAGTVVGGWTGRLSNSGEQIQLDDALGEKVCEVTYADSGDWALRGRGVLSFSHKGWDWYTEADGAGKTLELRNPGLGIDCGQNWGVSGATGGSPGAANSVVAANVAPLIKDVKHRPEIPKSTDPIVVSCRVEDELPGATATLRWRLTGNGAFASVPMMDTDGDGEVEASIGPQANLAVVECYIEATDGVFARTWPAPARTSDPGVTPETFGQVTNLLVLVDNSYDVAATFRTAADAPIYRLIMTSAERAELAAIGSTSGQQQSEASMNGTFISHDGTGIKVRYRCGFRNRGFGSALGPPNNYHISFAKDHLWNNRSSLSINCRYPYAQALGQALAARAGLPTQDSAVVKVRVNGTDLSVSTPLMYGRYVRIEGRNSDWVENHYPEDPDGNFYRLDDHAPGVVGTPAGNLGSGEFRYEGLDPAAYADTFLKETNADANDYTDLIQFCRIVSAPATGGTAEQPAIGNDDYPAALAGVLDLDHAFRYFATDALLGNSEGGFQTARADDVSIYRGVVDPRFRFIFHDLDTVFDIGDTQGGATRNIFSVDGGNNPGTGVLGLTRIFNHPQLVPRYYAALLEALDDWFTTAAVDAVVEQIMAGWVPATDGVAANRSITDIKAFVTARRNSVLAAIQQNYSLVTAVAGTDTPEGYKRTLTGAATFSGTFHVAKTYSVTVNGQLATWNYRTTSTTTAGTWSFTVPAGGGTVLHPGLNRVVVQFWSGINGTGTALQTLTADVLYQPLSATYTNVSGTIAPGTLRLTAPATYLPGKPILVRAEVLDANGSLNRAAWDGTVNLSANVPGLTFPAIQIYNGTGSALVNVGGGSGLPDDTVIALGSSWFYLDNGSNQGNTVSSPWRQKDFPEESAAPWKSGNAELGVNDGDEQTVVALNGTNPWTTYYFRKHFTLPAEIPYGSIRIRMRCDDGAIVYVNGVQAAITTGMTANMAFNASCTFNRVTTGNPNENTFETYTLPLSLFQPGENTIAVEVHNFSSGTDISFNLEMLGSYPPSDPGDFTLNASFTGSGNTLQAARALTSLTATPAITTVSGVLPDGPNSWSGVVQVTDDVTVPNDATLTIEPGTHVLVDGDATPGSTAGKRIIVNGALVANGTHAQPVAITATNAGDRWGGLVFNGADPSALNYTLLNHAGHTTGVGHTGRGPMIRLTGSSLNLDDSVLADGPAKAIYSSGTCDLNIRRSLIERMITGPELENGVALLVEDSNIQRILPDYRESNANAPDDEDCLYVHNDAGRSVIIRRSVFARCGDDVFDCLGGPITVEDSILREGWDKGMSLLNNDLTITRTQIIKCDKAIVPKSQNADTRTVIATNVTIVSENHDTSQAPWGYAIAPSSPDPDTPSTGFYTQNKSGQSNGGATLAIVAKNCIVRAESPVLVDAPYSAANTVVTYSDLILLDDSAFSWPGTGNIGADPLFVDAANGNYRLSPTSPGRNTGDPGMLDPDNSRVDMGALYSGGGLPGGNITWSAAGGPYRVTANATVPAGSTLTILPGTAVYFDPNVRLTIRGRVVAQGTPGGRITFSHVPGTVAAGDCDPIKNGTQTGPPKWGGVRVHDSMAQESIFGYCDFINAQGTSTTGQENYGSVGFIRSWGWVDHCTFAGTHLRMCYGRNSKMTVTHNVFPDMFLFDPVLNRIEEPPDFIAAADNNQEPLKNEYPTFDPELSGNPNFTANGCPVGGHFRVYYNEFFGNRGHNDVFDADAGRWGVPGDFLLDCRYNYFHGLTGDEHIDLGGDAYIASNVFERGTKDAWTSDTGYSSAISSGDKGAGTTIFVARNRFFDVDHCINLKLGTATIFEHNTVSGIHADFGYDGVSFGTPFHQDVKCAPINFFIPEDGVNPTFGDGAYMGFNIVSNAPRLFSGPDARKVSGNVVNDITTKIEFKENLLDQIAETAIGPNHPGGIFGGNFGPNAAGAPAFVDAANRNFALRPESPARGGTTQGLDFGATIPEWAYLAGGPPSTTPSTNASFLIGGPGIVAYKWRLDGGAWSAPVQIGTGGVFPRTVGQAMVRQATLNLNLLAAGSHTLEVLGQDAAGNWQDADPARTIAGLAQAAPTTRTWTVDPSFVAVRLSEILADSTTQGDTVELQNIGGTAVNLAGWSLTDDPSVPNKVPLGGTIGINGFLSFTHAALGLDKDGDSVYLYQGLTLRDSVSFGQQVTNLSLGRHPSTGAWTLGNPTLGAANTTVPVGDYSGVRINEWMASTGARYEDDWVELHNTSGLPALLTGLRLTDNVAGRPSGYVFPPLSFIGGNGFLRLIGDESGAPGRLPFELDAQREELALLYPNGRFLDRVSFYPQTTDFSMGRDGTGGYTFYELPTRGLANGTGEAGYANALAIIRGLRITEIMYNAIGGSDYDYLEFTNVGADPLDLNGVKFVEGVTFTFGPQVLGAGQSVVVVKHLTRFRNRYGLAPVVAGTYGGQLDNGGELLALQLPAPFDANILTFEYSDEWYPSSDGLGPAIAITNPALPAALWEEKDTWSASSSGGTPGGGLPRTDTFIGWMAGNGVLAVTDDRDRDTAASLVEFILGMDPNDGTGTHGIAGLPAGGTAVNGRATLSFLVPVNASAAQGHGFLDATIVVQAASAPQGPWTTIATKTMGANWSGTGTATVGSPAGEFVPVTIQDSAAPGVKRFLRLGATWTQL